MKIKKLNENAIIPTQGSKYAAGYDLYATEAYTIYPGKTVKISTGIAIEIPMGCFGAIFPRSGLATKQGLRLANCVAVIDSDYRGELTVPLYNDSDEVRIIKEGDRFAQIVFLPYCNFEFEEVEELGITDRGSGGFGSTGSR